VKKKNQTQNSTFKIKPTETKYFNPTLLKTLCCYFIW